MKVWKLTVNDPVGRIETFFEREQDARQTYRTTYSKVQDKPTFRVEEVEVLSDSTHL